MAHKSKWNNIVKVRKQQKIWRDQNKGKRKAYGNTVIGKIVHRLTQLKRGDKERKRDCKLETYVTKEDLLALWERSQNCHYCKCVMQFEDGRKKDGATIERLDNTLAHTKENCVLACRDCNLRHKSRFHTPSEQLTVKSST